MNVNQVIFLAVLVGAFFYFALFSFSYSSLLYYLLTTRYLTMIGSVPARVSVLRTTKRPVPLEHCIFYSGEFYKVCESETFIPQGLKAAKDAYKRKNSSAVVGGGAGSYGGSSAARSGAGAYGGSSRARGGPQSQKRESNNRGKQNKHSGPQSLSNMSKTGFGNSNNGGGQNNWGARRSEVSILLSLINKLSKKSLLPVCLIIPCIIVFQKAFYYFQSNPIRRVITY